MLEVFDSTEMDCRELKSFGYYMKNYGFNTKVECGKINILYILIGLKVVLTKVGYKIETIY